MNTSLVIVLVIAAIVGLPFVAALFIRREFLFQREIIINRPVGEVYDYVRLLANQDSFSKWVMMDPNMKKDLRGVDGTVGSIYAWDGNKKAGKGEQEIVGLKPNERVDIEVRFIRPFESTARTPIQLERMASGQTKVSWGMEGKSKYPLNLMNALMGSMLEKDLETSLTTLKKNLERSNAATGTPGSRKAF